MSFSRVCVLFPFVVACVSGGTGGEAVVGRGGTVHFVSRNVRSTFASGCGRFVVLVPVGWILNYMKP